MANAINLFFNAITPLSGLNSTKIIMKYTNESVNYSKKSFTAFTPRSIERKTLIELPPKEIEEI